MADKKEKRILIVEDARDIQLLLAGLLKAEGYTVECKSNGHDAIEFLKSSENLPSLILLDIMMPDMNGYEFREAQEKHARLATIPIVVMTADGNVQSKSMRVGAHGYLKKPFESVEQVLTTVSRFFPK